MFRSKRVRSALVLVIAAGLVAVWWSFTERRGSQSSRMPPSIAGDTSRRITDFEYLERRDGRVLFRLLAESNTEDREGTSLLSKVWLEHYDEDGQLIETVQGQRARYGRQDQQVVFEGRVVVDLVDGTRVLAEQLQADLKTGRIRIDGDFNLEKGDLRGRGRGLQYETQQRTLEVSDLDSMTLPLVQGVVEGRARRMSYDLNAHLFRLRGEAALRGPLRSLSGDEIVLRMTPARQLEQVDSEGTARLQAGPERSFEGHRIRLHFDTSARHLTHFEVLGRPDAPSVTDLRQAIFEQRTPGGGHRLQADRMIGRSEGGGPALSSLDALGNVVLRSSRLEIQDSQAARLLAGFGAETGGLQSLRMEGGVELLRRSADRARSEYLRARQLDIEVGPSGVLKRMTARQSVTLETVDGRVKRDLSAAEVVDLHYRTGLLAGAEAAGDPVLDVQGPAGRNVIRSSKITAAFMLGQLQRVDAGPAVELEMEEGGASRRTRGRVLTATFSAGQLVKAVQQGDVRLWESAEDSVVEIQSQRAELGAGGSISATGGRVLMRSEQTDGNRQETLADRISLDRGRGLVVATGQVETVSREGSEPVIVTAERMEIDRSAGSAHYTGSPRLVQGPTTVRGRELRVGGEEMTVEGEVRSELVEEGRAGARHYDIEAQRMRFVRAEGVVTYTGEVSVEGEDLTVTAPRVKLFLDAEHQEVERIEASGGATIVQQGRRWTGETATYYPRQERVVVGN